MSSCAAARCPAAAAARSASARSCGAGARGGGTARARASAATPPRAPAVRSASTPVATHSELRNARRSYFSRIHLSFSSRLEVAIGLTWPLKSASHIEFARSLPKDTITLTWLNGHSSRSRDRTRDICEPRFLCIPEHSMQINTPRFRLAQSGSAAPQSQHLSFPLTRRM